MSGPIATLAEAVAVVEAFVASLEPRCFGAGAALGVVEVLARLERLAAAGAVAMMPRIEETGAHRAQGFPTTALWLASVTGGEARRAIDAVSTARKLDRFSEVRAALACGDVSLDQAALVVQGAEADPGAECELVAAAKAKPLAKLKEDVRAVRARAEADPEERYRRQRDRRSFRHGVDGEGMVWGAFRLPPDTGAAVVNAVGAETDRQFRAARREGRRESHEAYAADALVSLVTTASVDGTAPADGGKGRRADVVVHVDRQALLRGRAEPGEMCEVEGVGPVPVSVAREIMADAFVKGVLVDGTDVLKVAHFGRRIPAPVRTALETRTALRDRTVRCEYPSCWRRRIEWDHRHDHALGGPTSYQNLDPLCPFHHREKTRGAIAKRDGAWARAVAATSGPDPP